MSPRPASDGTPSLSTRQTEILRLVAEGATTKEIAIALGLREQTVKEYLGVIYQKLGVNSRAACVYQASRIGLI